MEADSNVAFAPSLAKLTLRETSWGPSDGRGQRSRWKNQWTPVAGHRLRACCSGLGALTAGEGPSADFTDQQACCCADRRAVAEPLVRERRLGWEPAVEADSEHVADGRVPVTRSPPGVTTVEAGGLDCLHPVTTPEREMDLFDRSVLATTTR